MIARVVVFVKIVLPVARDSKEPFIINPIPEKWRWMDETWFLLPFCHQGNQSPVTCNRRWQIMVLTSKTAFNDFFKVWINVFERWSWPELSSALISILRCLLGQIMSVTDKTFFKGLKSLDKCLWAVSKETRPSINYAKDWLVWSRKEFHLWMWS